MGNWGCAEMTNVRLQDLWSELAHVPRLTARERFIFLVAALFARFGRPSFGPFISLKEGSSAGDRELAAHPNRGLSRSVRDRTSLRRRSLKFENFSNSGQRLSSSSSANQ
jgi:hypothetical protein